MWYQSESGERPVLVDKESSKVYVYVRKSIQEIEREDEQTGKTYIVYMYDEMKLPKEVYGIFEAQILADNRISDLEEVITEIVGGGF
jgi:hypothetical protein